MEYKAISTEARDLIQSALNAHISILIAGGTSSGKTTVANRIVELISPAERVVVVEQAHELQFDHPRSIFLEAGGAIAPINDLLTAGFKKSPELVVFCGVQGGPKFSFFHNIGEGALTDFTHPSFNGSETVVTLHGHSSNV